jgi:hypothetical protein
MPRPVLDFPVLVSAILCGNKHFGVSERRGFMNIIDLSHYAYVFLKSELERQFFMIFQTIDLAKSSQAHTLWVVEFRNNCLDRFMYGYMENNMGTYRLMTAH